MPRTPGGQSKCVSGPVRARLLVGFGAWSRFERFRLPCALGGGRRRLGQGRHPTHRQPVARRANFSSRASRFSGDVGQLPTTARRVSMTAGRWLPGFISGGPKTGFCFSASGQSSEWTVNLLAYAFEGSNPSPTTTPKLRTGASALRDLSSQSIRPSRSGSRIYAIYTGRNPCPNTQSARQRAAAFVQERAETRRRKASQASPAPSNSAAVLGSGITLKLTSSK